MRVTVSYSDHFGLTWMLVVVTKRMPGEYFVIELLRIPSPPLTSSVSCCQMEKSATLFRPKLMVAGASAYARHYDYGRMRKVSSGFMIVVIVELDSVCEQVKTLVAQ